MLTDILKQAMERAAQQPEQEQARIAQAVLEMLDADARWKELLSEPRTPSALDELWQEAQEDVKAGQAKEITGDSFDS